MNSVGLAASPPDFELKVAAFGPAQFLKGLPESLQFGLTFRIICLKRDQYSDASCFFMLLRTRRERPHRRSAAEQRDKFASPHSMTSSALASRVGGTVSPRAFAVLRLITSHVNLKLAA